MELLQGANAIFYMIAILGAGVALERLAPWRREQKLSVARWLRAAALNANGIILLGVLPAISGYGAALLAEREGLGLFNIVRVPYWSELAVAVLVADALAFGQHWALHRWTPLWRLHRTHHLDRAVDASTALRFHPLETLFRAAVEAPVIVILGVPPDGVLLAFGVFVIVNLYTHWNVNIPDRLERALAPVFITPSMHRLHHGVDAGDQRANYGTILSVWDRLLGSMRGPERLRRDARFGLEGPDSAARESFALLLLDPFRSPTR